MDDLKHKTLYVFVFFLFNIVNPLYSLKYHNDRFSAHSFSPSSLHISIFFLTLYSLFCSLHILSLPFSIQSVFFFFLLPFTPIFSLVAPIFQHKYVYVGKYALVPKLSDYTCTSMPNNQSQKQYTCAQPFKSENLHQVYFLCSCV